MATLAPFHGVPHTQVLPPLVSLDLHPTGDMTEGHQGLAPFNPRAPDAQVQVLPSIASLRVLPEDTIATGYVVAEHVELAPFVGPDVPDTLVLPSLSSRRLLPRRAAQPHRLTGTASQPQQDLPPVWHVQRYYRHVRPYDRTMLRSIEVRTRLMAQSPRSTGAFRARRRLVAQSPRSTSTLNARPSPLQHAVANTAAEQTQSPSFAGTFGSQPPPQPAATNAAAEQHQSPSSAATIGSQFPLRPAVANTAAEVVVKKEEKEDDRKPPRQAASPRAPAVSNDAADVVVKKEEGDNKAHRQGTSPNVPRAPGNRGNHGDLPRRRRPCVVKQEDNDNGDNDDEPPRQSTSPRGSRVPGNRGNSRGLAYRRRRRPRSLSPRAPPASRHNGGMRAFTDPSNALGTFEPHMSPQPPHSRRATVPQVAALDIARLEKRFIPPGNIFNAVVGKIMPRILSDDDPKRSIIKKYTWDTMPECEKMDKLIQNPFYRRGDETLQWEQFYDVIFRRFARASRNERN